MSILLLVLVLVLGVGALLAHLARVVRLDGLGHRPPPTSHVPWDSPPLDGSGWG